MLVQLGCTHVLLQKCYLPPINCAEKSTVYCDSHEYIFPFMSKIKFTRIVHKLYLNYLTYITVGQCSFTNHSGTTNSNHLLH